MGLQKRPFFLQGNAWGNNSKVLGCPPGSDADPIAEIHDFPEFARAVLDWRFEDLYGALGSPAVPDSLVVSLTDYGETLRPTFALREYEIPLSSTDPAREWLLLIETLPPGTKLDESPHSEDRRWQASPQSRFERLLRETGVPAGLLVNGIQVRLVYAPKGESSGHITFIVAEMVKVAGLPIFAAFHMLLCFDRLYLGEEKHRLAAMRAAAIETRRLRTSFEYLAVI